MTKMRSSIITLSRSPDGKDPANVEKVYYRLPIDDNICANNVLHCMYRKMSNVNTWHGGFCYWHPSFSQHAFT